MDKPTEHQPLDDFFRRRISDASIQPSDDGWNRLQSRLTEQKLGAADKPVRRIGAAWYWATSVAAACLLIVYSWVSPDQSAFEKNTHDIATTTRPGKKIAPSPDHSGPVLVTSKMENVASASSPIDKREPNVDSSKPLVEEKDKRIENKTNRLITEPKAEIEQPRFIAKNLEKQPEKKAVQSESEQNSAIASTNGASTAKATQTSPERTLIVSVVETTSHQLPVETTTQNSSIVDVQEAPVKNNRIANVFRQIKRIKDGEALAKADVSSNEEDDDSGLFNRLVRSARSKDNQVKQQK